MAQARITMTLSPESRRQLLKLSRAEIKPELRRALMTSTSGAVPAVRAKARSLPSKKRKRTKLSLRSQIAMAIKRRIGATYRGVWVAIVSEPHGGLANLARCVEGEIPWVHPTFGHAPDVDQKPMPFFYDTLEKIIPGMEVAVRDALIRFERKV